MWLQRNKLIWRAFGQIAAADTGINLLPLLQLEQCGLWHERSQDHGSTKKPRVCGLCLPWGLKPLATSISADLSVFPVCGAVALKGADLIPFPAQSGVQVLSWLWMTAPSLQASSKKKKQKNNKLSEETDLKQKAAKAKSPIWSSWPRQMEGCLVTLPEVPTSALRGIVQEKRAAQLLRCLEKPVPRAAITYGAMGWRCWKQKT